MGANLSLLATTASAMLLHSNLAPLRDVHNQLMDVHDGSIVKWNGRYYMHGMSYTNCTLEYSQFPPHYCPGVFFSFGNCGFRDDHGLAIYSSENLVSWRYEGDGLPIADRPRGIYFRPKVIHDAARDEFVLWINYLPRADDYWPMDTPLAAYISTSTHIVAKAKTPNGPFVIVNTDAKLQVANAADFALLATPELPDGGAYIAYDAWDNGHAIRIEKLSDDLTRGSGNETHDLSPAGNEAPLLFERNGWYYLAYGHVCCFCAEGGGAVLLVARHPLGPWKETGVDLNPRRGKGGKCGATIPVQNNHVFQIANGFERQYVFVADLWRTAPDGLKSHDLQFWAPLTFDDSVEPPLPHGPLEWIDGFEIQLPIPSVDGEGGAPSYAVDEVAKSKIEANAALCVDSSGIHPELAMKMVLWSMAVAFVLALMCRVCKGRRRPKVLV